MDSGDTDSDDKTYTTPPESNQEEEIVTVEEEDNPEDDPINPNTAEITDDESEQDITEDNDSELEEILNNPSNNTTIELGNLLNLSDILDIQGNNTETQSPGVTPGSTHRSPIKNIRQDSPRT